MKRVKQAFLIEGMGDSSITQKLINKMDDESVDFYVHWDAKFNTPNFYSKNSRIYYLKARRISWGGTSLTKVSFDLLRLAFNNGNYDFYHILSSKDFVLMDKESINRYLLLHLEYQFVDLKDDAHKYSHRVNTYHFLENFQISRKVKYITEEIFGQIQSLFGVKRLPEGIDVGKGEHWVTLNRDFVEYVLSNQVKKFVDSMLKFTFISDEMVIPTLLINSKFKNKVMNSGRIIDWTRGNPYQFTEDDVEEVRSYMDESMFIRKVNLPLVNKLIKCES